MQKVGGKVAVEGTCKQTLARVALDRREEGEIPARVARCVKRALCPGTVRAAVVGEDPRIDVECVVEPGGRSGIGAYAAALQHQRRLSEIGGKPPRVGVAGILAEVDRAKPSFALLGVERERLGNETPLGIGEQRIEQIVDRGQTAREAESHLVAPGAHDRCGTLRRKIRDPKQSQTRRLPCRFVSEQRIGKRERDETCVTEVAKRPEILAVGKGRRVSVVARRLGDRLGERNANVLEKHLKLALPLGKDGRDIGCRKEMARVAVGRRAVELPCRWAKEGKGVLCNRKFLEPSLPCDRGEDVPFVVPRGERKIGGDVIFLGLTAPDLASALQKRYGNAALPARTDKG